MVKLLLDAGRADQYSRVILRHIRLRVHLGAAAYTGRVDPDLNIAVAKVLLES
jgi:hypothetical protein